MKHRKCFTCLRLFYHVAPNLGDYNSLKRHLIMTKTILSILLFSSCSFAQPWSGILDPSRAVNWQRSTVGVIGGIPTTYPACTTAQAGTTVPIAAYTGTAAAINTAASNCMSANPSGSYLLLGSGTFNLTTSIDITGGSNFILRGSGPTQTTLNFDGASGSGSGSAIIVQGANLTAGSGNVGSDVGSTPQPCVTSAPYCGSWTAGYALGATSITVSNLGSGGGGIHNGDLIMLDQANVTSDNGGFFACDTNSPAVCLWKPSPGGQIGREISGTYYSQEQAVTVTAGCSTACTGTGPFTLTISPGLYGKAWNTAAVGVWWGKGQNYLGLESFTVNASSVAGDSSYKGITQFESVNNGWVKNVRSIEANRNHVWILNSAHIEVRDSYFYGSSSGGSQSYGIEFFPGFDSLVENNIFQQVGAPFISSGAGNVISYNFSRNGGASGAESYMGASYMAHDPGVMFNLFEGNQFYNGLFCDQTWGTSGLDTAFRNRLYGLDYEGPTLASVQTNPFMIMSYCRGYNIIGNVLGTPGYHSGSNSIYEAYPTSSNPPVSTWSGGTSTQCNQAIYVLGWGSGVCAVVGSDPNSDPGVRNSLMRWGNYDTFNAAVQWSSTESSPGAVANINANSTPATHTLPSSFYLSSTPSFFGSTPFPAIGPDVSGGSGPGGYAYAIPSANCAFNIMSMPSDGSGSVLAFDANTCYYSSPSSPLVTVVVH
jgi:hypothetical protein